MCNAVCLTTIAAEVERNRFRISFFDNAAQCWSNFSARRIQHLVEMTQVFFGITNDSDPVELISAAVRQNEIVAPPDVRKRRCDVSRHRIGMKLFVCYDPHLDLLLPHHREQHRVETFPQPALSHGLLFAH